jgi:hypothetical protein
MNTMNSTSDTAAAYPTGHAIGSPTQAYSQAKTSSLSYATAQEAAVAAYAAYAARTSTANSAGASQQQQHQQQQQQQQQQRQQLAASNSMQYSTSNNAGSSSSSSASNTAASIVGKELSDATSTGLNLPVLQSVSSDDVVAAMTALDAVCGDYWALPPHHALVLTKALVNEALESPGVKGRVSGSLHIVYTLRFTYQVGVLA